MMKEFLKALRPVKRRIRRNRFLRGAAAGLAAGLAAAVILQAAAFLMPVPGRRLWAAVTAAAAMLLGALVNAARPVKNLTAAKSADACGLKERAVTALEGDDAPIRQLQRKDTCEALAKLDVRRIRPGSMKKELLAGLCSMALLGCLLLVPNTQDTKAEAREALNKALQEGQKAVEQAVEKDEERLPDEKKGELRKIAADLKRELNESREAADALVALDRAGQRLEQMSKKTAGDVSAGADTATDARDTYGDQAEGAEGNMFAEDTGLTANSQAETLFAAGTETGMPLQTLEALSALKGAVNPSLQYSSAGAANRPSGLQAGPGSKGTGNSGVPDGQNGAAAGGKFSGGKAGSGAGEGTTNEEQQGGESSSGASVRGNRDPRYQQTEYETIYDPEHIDKNKQNVITEQFRTGDEGSVQTETGPGRGNLYGDVPWGEVLQDYAETEARAADRENLTMQEKQWVNEYYKLLTEQQ